MRGKNADGKKEPTAKTDIHEEQARIGETFAATMTMCSRHRLWHLLRWILLLRSVDALRSSACSRIGIDLGCEKSVGGVSSFDRNVFVNMHYNLFSGDLDEKETEHVLGELDVNIGRFAGGPLRTYLQGATSKELREAGAQWRSHLLAKGSVEDIRTYQTKDVVVFDNYTVFEAARRDPHGYARHVHDHFRAFYDPQEGVPYPRYYEPMNEPFVHLQSSESPRVFRHMSELMDVVCRHLKRSELRDTVLVGGYAAGWVGYEGDDFATWRRWMKTYLDVAGSCIDFVSFHPYNIAGTKLDAVMDMIDTYTERRFGAPKPFVISEFGATTKRWYDRESKVAQPYTPSRDWKIISQCAQMILQFMTRPDRILKAVPFILGRAMHVYEAGSEPSPWVIRRPVPSSPSSAAADGSSPAMQWTHLKKLYEILAELRGDFRRVHYQDPYLAAHVLVDQASAFLVVVNRHATQRRRVCVHSLGGGGGTGTSFPTLPLQSVVLRRLFLRERRTRSSAAEDRRQGLTRSGVPTLQTLRRRSMPTSLLLQPEEIVLVRLDLVWTPPLERRATQHQLYATEYLSSIRTNRPLAFHFLGRIRTASAGEVTLRISLSRKSFLSAKGIVTFNGALIESEPDLAGFPEDRWEYWVMWSVRIPSELVRPSHNEATITFPESGGVISSCVLEVEQVVTYIPGEGGPRPPSSPDDPEAKEVGKVSNGDFEMGPASWDFFGDARITEDVSQSRSHSVELHGAKARLQQVVPIEHNSMYVVSAQARVQDNTQEIRLEIHGRGRHLRTALLRSKAWGRISVELPSVDEREILLSFATGEDSTGYVDNVRIREVTFAEEAIFVLPFPDRVPSKAPFVVKVRYSALRERNLTLQMLQKATRKVVFERHLRVGPGKGQIAVRVEPTRPLWSDFEYRLQVELHGRKNADSPPLIGSEAVVIAE